MAIEYPRSARHREPQKGLFRTGLQQLMDGLPSERKATVQAQLETNWSSYDSVKRGGNRFVRALADAASDFPPFGEGLFGLLSIPLATADCESSAYACAARAAAQIARCSPQQAITLVHALQKNLVESNNEWISNVLESLVADVPRTVLHHCLYDALCVGSARADDAARVLAAVSFNWRDTQRWLGSSFPGPRGAALAYVARRTDFHDRFPALAIEAMADRDANLRALAVKLTCGFKFRAEFKDSLVAALHDRDWGVCYSLGLGLCRSTRWTSALLPDLLPVLRDHRCDYLRQFVAKAIGRLKQGGTIAIPALKTLAKHECEDVSAAACKALARIAPQKFRQRKAG